MRCQEHSALLRDFCAPVKGQIILSLFEKAQHTAQGDVALYWWAEDI